MKCPVCKSEGLIMTELENGLVGNKCGKCEGSWIRQEDYEKWMSSGHIQDGHAPNEEYLPEYDTKKANLCPDCGRILIKYNVSSDLPFFVDHCGSCNGVWLDKNEWEQLIRKDLDDDMNRFFTIPWQNNLRNEMSKKRMEDHYISKFGSENYEKIKGIREWIYANDLKDYFMSYLMDDDPYRI